MSYNTDNPMPYGFGQFGDETKTDYSPKTIHDITRLKVGETYTAKDEPDKLRDIATASRLRKQHIADIKSRKGVFTRVK